MNIPSLSLEWSLKYLSFYVNKIISLGNRVMLDWAWGRGCDFSHALHLEKYKERFVIKSKCKSTTVRAGAVVFPV